MTNKKKKMISEDMKKVKELLKDIPDDRRSIANSLYNELVFMQNTLQILKKQVQEEGAVSMFKQGKQEFLREHPALKAYNTTIQRYNLIYKQFIELLPESEGTEMNDPLIDFISQKELIK